NEKTPTHKLSDRRRPVAARSDVKKEAPCASANLHKRAIVKLYKTFKCMIFPIVIDRSIPVIMRGSFMALVITLLSLQMVRSNTGNAQGILDRKISVSVS